MAQIKLNTIQIVHTPCYEKLLIQIVHSAHICKNDMLQTKDMFQIVATWLQRIMIFKLFESPLTFGSAIEDLVWWSYLAITAWQQPFSGRRWSAFYFPCTTFWKGHKWSERKTVAVLTIKVSTYMAGYLFKNKIASKKYTTFWCAKQPELASIFTN